MSPELETLDQLLGGDLPLSVVYDLFPDEQSFGRGIHALLSTGDVRLLTNERMEVPHWRRRELLVNDAVLAELPRLRLVITPQGAARVA